MAEAEALGHCHCFVEVAGHASLECASLANAIAWLPSSLHHCGIHGRRLVIDVSLQRPAAASKVACYLPEDILKYLWVEQAFMLSRRDELPRLVCVDVWLTELDSADNAQLWKPFLLTSLNTLEVVTHVRFWNQVVVIAHQSTKLIE